MGGSAISLDPDNQPVAAVAELDAAFQAADALTAINRVTGVTLDVAGDGATLDGPGTLALTSVDSSPAARRSSRACWRSASTARDRTQSPLPARES